MKAINLINKASIIKSLFYIVCFIIGTMIADAIM
jgi:hypothetical protein